MKKSSIPIGLLILLLILLWALQGHSLLAATPSYAAGSAGYQLDASVIAGGGGSLQHGPYTLTGTAGQMEAAHLFLGSGQTLRGGFWHGRLAERRLFLPLTIK